MTYRIRELRLQRGQEAGKKRGYSLVDLSNMTGIPKTNLGDLERHVRLPRAGELEAIAKALCVTVDELER